MNVEEQLAALQAVQFGLVTSRQGLAAGCSYKAQRRRMRAGLLVELHPGVFANPCVADCFDRRALAAVLAAGVTAFASHETAAHLSEMPLRRPAAIEVTTALERQPRLDGVRMHRSGLLIERDVMTIRGIPVSTPERTIVDLSSRLTELELGCIIDDALRRRIVTLGRVYAALERLRRAPGRSPSKLRRVLDRRAPAGEGRESVLEDFVAGAIRRFELPPPVSQHEVVVDGQRRRIDLAYVSEKIALEAKGFEYHGGRARFDDDTRRANELRLAGWTVLEFTSAFTDLQIAECVARALGVQRPRPQRALTFEEWKRLR
jgi:hypothetical protein